MGKITAVAWVLGVLTAGWFGFQAYRSGRGVLLWSVAGGLFGLIAATFVFGLGHAFCIPFSDSQRKSFYIEWIGAAIVIIALLGWIFTLGLSRGRNTPAAPGSPPR